MARLTVILTLLTTVVALLGGFRWALNEWKLWRQKRKWLILILICLSPSPVLAYTTTGCTHGETGTCRLTDGTLSDAQAAHTDSTASDGTYYRDGIYLPDTHSSIPTWASALTITKKGIVVVGVITGPMSERDTGDYTLGTIIKCSGVCILTRADYVRVTGVTWWGLSTVQLYQCDQGHVNDRLDHSNFIGDFGYAFLNGGVGNSAGCEGVFDHNVINARDAVTPNTDGGVGVYFTGDNEGCPNHFQAIDFGSSHWMYAEDNTFYSSSDSQDFNETHWDGKGVWRHNRFLEAGVKFDSFVDQHNSGSQDCGLGSSNNNSADGRAFIFSDNFVELNLSGGDSNPGALFKIRSGTGLVYNNMISYYKKGTTVPKLQFVSFRASGGEFATVGDCPDLGTDTVDLYMEGIFPSAQLSGKCAATTYTTTAAAYHGHPSGTVTGEGWPLNDGIGAGPFVCAGPGLTNCTYATQREPFYIWNNQYQTGASTFRYWTTGDIQIGASTAWAIQLDRDYCFAEITQPTSCDGISLSYTEYTYPHPLQGLGETTTSVLSPAIFIEWLVPLVTLGWHLRKAILAGSLLVVTGLSTMTTAIPLITAKSYHTLRCTTAKAIHACLPEKKD